MKISCIKTLEQFWRDRKNVPDLRLQVEPCPPEMGGDITLNCFRLATPLRGNPVALAQESAEFLRQEADVAAVEVVKAFVNIRLQPAALYRDTVADPEALLNQPLLPAGERRRYLVEYSAPNTNKPLHLGHVRNNTLGLALVGLLSRVGHEVVPVNLINDRGVHICRSMIAYQRFGNGCTPESTGLKGDHLVGEFYKKYGAELTAQIELLKAADPSLADKGEEELFLRTEIGRAAQDLLLAWEHGDAEVRRLWQVMNGWVIDGFNHTYRRMGVTFRQVYLESDTYTLGRDIIEGGLARGAFQRRADGAIDIDLTRHGLGQKVLLRADGTSVYITQDLGTTLLKHQDHRPDTMIWIVGNEQIHHFKVLFAILSDLGYPWAHSLHHLAYGMVNLPSGRMKSREGTVVDADQLFDEMHELARAEILKRVEGDIPEDLDTRAEAIAMGGVKFMLLKVNAKTTMMFDPSAAVKFEGDTGAYVQYATARIASIRRKAADVVVEAPADWSLLTEKRETVLALKCAEYGAVLQKAARDLDPSGVANYLLELAKCFNAFYHDCPVIKGDLNPELSRARLKLIGVVRAILVDGLATLTVEALDSM